MAAKAAKADRGTRQLELVAVADPAPEVLAEPRKPKRRATAEEMASRQREISISEFFTKNRHLLGFDNPSKALLTTIKEAVDNSLDACEEAEQGDEARHENEGLEVAVPCHGGQSNHAETAVKPFLEAPPGNSRTPS